MGLESRCTIRQYQPPPSGDVDPELCTSLNGASSSLSAVSFSVGLVGRLRPDKATYPYVRAGVGVVARTRNTIELIGTFADTARNALEEVIIVGDSFPNKTRAHLTFAAGLALSLGPASQLRLEARDIVTSLDRVTGLADASRGTARRRGAAAARRQRARRPHLASRPPHGARRASGVRQPGWDLHGGRVGLRPGTVCGVGHAVRHC